jgi:photosystem II stability/assembly factor-like uncharacterized protein
MLGGGLAVYDGRQWTSTAEGLLNQVVFGIAVDSAADRTIYAGTAGSGVLKTVDGGARWSATNDGLAHRVVKAIVMDPASPRTLFVAAQEQFLGSRGGVFRTTDGAAHWTQVGAQTLMRRVFSLTFDPSTRGQIYAGTDGGGIYRSTDNGDTWASIDGGALVDSAEGVTSIQQAMHPHPVYAIALDAADSRILYAGTDTGVFRSRDAGAHWAPASSGLRDRRVRALVAHPVARGTLYAGTGDLSDLGRAGGVFKSTDGGESWIPAGLPGQWVLALAVHPRRPAMVCAGTDQGVLCSDDGGVRWTAVATGGEFRYVLSLVASPSRPDLVFAGTEGNSIMKIAWPAAATTARRP